MRKAAHRELSTFNVKQYNHIQQREAYNLVEGFFNEPAANLRDLCSRFSGAIGLGAIYDIKVTSIHDQVVTDFHNVIMSKLAFLVPGVQYYDALRKPLIACLSS
jgi:hypothetical protein